MKISRLPAFSSILLVAACALQGDPTGPNRAASIEGIWELCMDVQSATRTQTPERFSAGFLSLTRTHEIPRSWMYLGQPTHYGVYTVDLSRIGLAGARVTGALSSAPADQGSPSTCQVHFLVPGAPHHLLYPGNTFELYEGRRCVAVGEVLD